MTPATLTDLADPTLTTARLRSAGYRVSHAQPAYIRHKLGQTTIIAYRLELCDGTNTWSYAHWCQDPGRADEIHHKALTLRPHPSRAGPGLSRIDNHTIFYAFPNDAQLRRLRWYTEPRKLKRSLEALTGTGGRISGSHTTVDVLRYKPERRAVARVDLATTTGRQPLLVRYSSQRQALRLSHVATHLRAHGIDTPAPLAQLDDDRVNVDEYIEGVQLCDAVRTKTIEPAVIASAIARFHATSAPAATPRRTAAGDLSRALHGLAGLSAWDRSLAHPARTTATALRAHLPQTSSNLALLHGDLHSQNVLASDQRISFVDLERVAIGPAAIDLGFLKANAIALGVSQPDWSPHAADHARSVTDLYQSDVAELHSGELAWHTALGLVEHALLVARRLETNWQHASRQLLEAAQHQIHRPRVTSGASPP